jgi:hypothetical protein
MIKRKPTKREVVEGLAFLLPLMKDPYGEEANKALDEQFGNYKKQVQEFGRRHELLQAPGWLAWFRLIQIRFVRLVCDDRPAVASMIRQFIESNQPSMELLMREVLRQCFLEWIEWGKTAEAKSRGKPPKGPAMYWKEAFDSFKVDLEKPTKKTFRDVPEEEYTILGVYYGV